MVYAIAQDRMSKFWPKMACRLLSVNIRQAEGHVPGLKLKLQFLCGDEIVMIAGTVDEIRSTNVRPLGHLHRNGGADRIGARGGKGELQIRSPRLQRDGAVVTKAAGCPQQGQILHHQLGG